MCDTNMIVDYPLHLDELMCPLSIELINEPVIAEDGHIYERCIIEEWIVHNSVSPVTGCSMGKKLINCYFLKNLINSLTKMKPELKEIQYKPNTDYEQNKSRIKKFILEGDVDKLLNYVNFTSEFFENKLFHEDSIINDNNILKHIFKNCDISKCVYVELLGKIIEYNDNPLEIIKYVVDEGFDLKLTGNFSKGWNLLHFSCFRNNMKCTKYLVDKGISLEAKTYEDNWYPIHAACYYSSAEIIKYLISNRANLNNRITMFLDENKNYGCIELVNKNHYLTRDEKDDIINLIKKINNKKQKRRNKKRNYWKNKNRTSTKRQ